jgi:hypothetical protein
MPSDLIFNMAEGFCPKSSLEGGLGFAACCEDGLCPSATETIFVGLCPLCLS